MLDSIRIKDLGLISEAEVDFQTGFVAITGETGAGKTLLLDAVRILRGEKPTVVGSVTDATVQVDASISVARNQMTEKLSDLGVETDEGFLLVSRTFPNNGRAKTTIGGRPFPAATLEELSDYWLAIHGQHDSLRLMKPQTHRELLDSFGGKPVAEAFRIFSDSFIAWKALLSDLNKVEKSRKELLANAEGIKADLSIFESLNISEGDVAKIAETVERVSRKEEFKSSIAAAIAQLQGEEYSVSSALTSARQSLEKLSSDSNFNRLREQLLSLLAEVMEIEAELNSQFVQLENEDDDLDSLMMKQRQIKSLLLRHGPNEQDLIEWAESAKRQLALIDPDGLELTKLKNRVKEAEVQVKLAADKLSDERRNVAVEFSKIVTSEIHDLAMPAAEFSVEITETDLSEFGQDKIEFLFNANPGMKPQPLVSAASGGELSRVMLALEVALLSTASPSVLIFDEVDAGVAGSAAISVGQKLSKLSQISQVLVVTHLPQIAAFADQHINVSKATDGFVTQTSIKNLAETDRVVELSRMMAGLEGSESATAHAVELIEMANTFKRGQKSA